MSTVPSKISARIAAGIKRFQPILAAAATRDVNESDTVVIVTDILSEMLGYDKYAEVTSEHAIRGTYCDLAVKLDGKVAFLIEVKAIGLDLRDAFTKQAIDYAANQGVEWVVLTNGATWRAYKVSFTKPITNELVLDLTFANLNSRSTEDIAKLFLLSKEGWQRSKIDEYQVQREALSRYSIAALLLSDPVLDVIRRELRRVSPGVKIEESDIQAVLEQEVLKRDALEGDRAAEAKRRVNRASNKSLRRTSAPDVDAIVPDLPVPPAPTGALPS